MTRTAIHRVSVPAKRWLPRFLTVPARALATAALVPMRFSWRTGHLRSCLVRAPVDRRGRPLPWYAYPAIDFLSQRDMAGRRVLEFGAGHSTLWWASRGAEVVALEGDRRWYERLARRVPDGVALAHVRMDDRATCREDAERAIEAAGGGPFDLLAIDGLYREDMVPLARAFRAPDGAILVDNADGYGMQAALADAGLQRVDFFGHAPGVLLPHATSLWFPPGCWLVDPAQPLPKIAHQGR